jgi:hypothetical protein
VGFTHDVRMYGEYQGYIDCVDGWMVGRLVGHGVDEWVVGSGESGGLKYSLALHNRNNKYGVLSFHAFSSTGYLCDT